MYVSRRVSNTIVERYTAQTGFCSRQFIVNIKQNGVLCNYHKQNNTIHFFSTKYVLHCNHSVDVNLID